MSSELILAIVGLVGALGAAAATIVSAMRKADEGNYVTLQNRLESAEETISKQDRLLRHLSHWQLISRELNRRTSAQLIEAGIEPTEPMKDLQRRLEQELSYDEIMADAEPPARRPRPRRRRGGAEV